MKEQEPSAGRQYSAQTFRSHFTDSYTSEWRCGHCEEGYLRLKGDKVLASHETLASCLNRREINVDPSEIDERFISEFICTRCTGITLCLGKTSYDLDDWCKYETHYTPQFFQPPIAYFKIPATCPWNVRAAIQESFAVACLGDASEQWMMHRE